MERAPPPDPHGQVHPALERVRREGRWWWLQARHARRVWRWALLAALVLFVAMVALRRPLADWVWKEPQIEQLLDQGALALASGRLSSDDGTGARERFQAALALDGDRMEARDGLARTADAALAQARKQLEAGELDAAAHALALARELQVPQRDADAVAQRLRERRAAQAGLDGLREAALKALADGRLDAGEDSALPLFQRILSLRPDDLPALEGREDAMSDLLQRARAAAARGDIAAASAVLQRAGGFDAGHADLPGTREALAQALERRLRQGARELRRGRLEAAAQSYEAVRAVAPEDAGARRGSEQVVQALLKRGQGLAGDFQFAAAEQDIALARSLGAGTDALARATQQVQRARLLQASQRGPARNPAEREAQLVMLLARVREASRAGQVITPPGRSAYDALREAQALAPRDARVREASTALVPASRQCFDDNLRQNRVQAAGACLQAWQTLAPGSSGYADARRRLAERWLAIGSERLGRGDVAFAERAAEQAGQWQPGMADLPAFRERVRRAAGEPR